MECSLCFEESVDLLPWSSSCEHPPCCLLCSLRHLHNELSVSEDTRITCYSPLCNLPLSPSTLESIIAFIPPDPSLSHPLGPGAIERARHRLTLASRAALLSTALVALEGSNSSTRLVNCPQLSCTAIIALEPSPDGLGRLSQCLTCSCEVCSSCGMLWSGSQPILSHRGVRCDMINLIREADVRMAREREIAASAVPPPTHSESQPTASAETGLQDGLDEQLSTFKRCPQCSEGISHFRGHSCHHISPGPGCPACRRQKFPHPAHFCYVCLGPWPCIDAQGQGCNTYCDPSCDCADCPQCAPFNPCDQCSGPQGGCRVCSGEISAGGEAGEAAWLLSQAQARREKRAKGWWGPQKIPRAPWGGGSRVSHHPAMGGGAGGGGGGGGGGPPPPAPLQTLLRSLAIQRSPLPLALALHAFTVAVTPGGENDQLYPSPRGHAIHTLHCLAVLRDVLAPHYPSTGGGVAPPPPTALSEAVLELFEVLGGAPTAGEVARGEGSAAAVQRVTAMARMGCFGVLQCILHKAFSTSAGGSGVAGAGAGGDAGGDVGGANLIRRALGVLSSTARVGMAGGLEVPQEAEDAFDAMVGLPGLIKIAIGAAVAGDRVILQSSLSALAGTRLHTKVRVQQAKAAIPLLVCLLLGSTTLASLPSTPSSQASHPPAPSTTPTPFHEDSVNPLSLNAAATGAGGAEGVEVTEANPVPSTSTSTSSSSSTSASPSPPSNTPPLPPPLLTLAGGGALLTPSSAASAIIALARALEVSKWSVGEVAHLNGVWGGRGSGNSPFLPLPPPVLQCMALSPPRGGEGGGGGVPLWEAVVCAGGIRSLQWRSTVASWSPTTPFPALLHSLIRALPTPPTAIASRAAVLEFSPSTLRARLARDEALQEEIAEETVVAQVPLWLKILVSPIAAAYLIYSGCVWLGTEGVVLGVGYACLLVGRAARGAFTATRAVDVYFLGPLGVGLYWGLIHPLVVVGRAANTFVLGPTWRGVVWVALGVGAWGTTWVVAPLTQLAVWVGTGVGRGVKGVVLGVSWVGEGVWVYCLHPLLQGLRVVGKWVGWGASQVALGARTVAWTLAWAVHTYALLPLYHCGVAVGRGVSAVAQGLYAYTVQPLLLCAHAIHTHTLLPCWRALVWFARWVGEGVVRALAFTLKWLGQGLYQLAWGVCWVLYYSVCWPLYWASVGLHRGSTLVGRQAYRVGEYVWVVAVAPVCRVIWGGVMWVVRGAHAAGAAVVSAGRGVARAVSHAVSSALTAAHNGAVSVYQAIVASLGGKRR